LFCLLVSIHIIICSLFNPLVPPWICACLFVVNWSVFVSLIIFLLGIFVVLCKVTWITHLCVLRLTPPYMLHCLQKGMWETPRTYGRMYSGQMRLKLSFLAIKDNAMSGANPTPPHSEAWWWQRHAVGMFFIGRDWETGRNWRNDGRR
jgi:hypothetical protein